MSIRIWKTFVIGSNQIEKSFFGGNMLFDRDRLDGTFSEVVTDLGVTGLRYPGGGLTEKRNPDTGDFFFDVTNPDATFSGKATVMPISEFIDYANTNDLDMSFVIPTSEAYGINYYMDFDDPAWTVPVDENGEKIPYQGIEWNRYNSILNYARALIDGKFGDISGATLEIGNEFYAIDNYTGVTGPIKDAYAYTSYTAKWYGIVASQLAKDISDYAVEVGRRDAIEIHVQAGRTERGGIKDNVTQWNSAVLHEFDGDELAAVDGVISHFYPWDERALDPNDPDSRGLHNNDRANYIDAWNSAAGRKLTSNVSEWNVGSPNGVDGLHQVAVLAEFFEFFQRNDVDMASIWALQQRTQNDLSGDEGDSSLTLAGEFFQMSSHSLIGKTLFESNISNNNLESYLFADNGNNITIILVNKTEVPILEDLNLNGIATSGDMIAVSTLKAYDDGTGTPAYIDPAAEAHLSVVSFDASVGSIDLDFMERGVIMVNITKTKGFDIQSDLSIGAFSGATGAETFSGSRFADQIDIGAGDDTVSAGAGDDLVQGGTGNDLLDGGDGDDLLYGEAGDDRLVGGNGNDTLYGGDGRDVLITDGGNDELWGGAGEDWFVFDSDNIGANSHITVKDFDPTQDRLVLVGGTNQYPVRDAEGRFVLNDRGATVTFDGAAPEADAFMFKDELPESVEESTIELFASPFPVFSSVSNAYLARMLPRFSSHESEFISDNEEIFFDELIIF